MVSLRPEQIIKILEITDSFNIHRESVVIPLKTEDQGSLKLLPDGKLRITCPTDRTFDRWLDEIREQLQTMDLTKLVRKE